MVSKRKTGGTTLTTIPNLQVRSQDDQGRVYYDNVIRRIKGVSQYNQMQYSLDGLPGFWESRIPLNVGVSYDFRLATRPKPPGPQTKPGSMYQDIKSAVPADGDPHQNPPDPWSPNELPEPWAGPQTTKDPIQTRIELGMAFNGAIALYASGCRKQGIMFTDTIRQLRDELYYEVIQAPPVPPEEELFPESGPPEADSGASEPEAEPVTGSQATKFCPTHQMMQFDVNGNHPILENGAVIGTCSRGE